LRHWDAHYANEQERERARAENARAGWYDLNEPAVTARPDDVWYRPAASA